MNVIRVLPGIVGLIVGAATIFFTFIHPTDFAVLTLLVNLSFLFLACYFVFGIGMIGQVSANQPAARKHILLVRLFFVMTVILVNLVIRNERSRATILADPLRKVLSLQGKTYEFKRDEFPGDNFPEGRVTGVIAQEIEQVLPQLVGTRRDGYKGVAYQEIVPVLIEAVKEQQKIIDNQRKEIGEIKVKLQGMKKP